MLKAVGSYDVSAYTVALWPNLLDQVKLRTKTFPIVLTPKTSPQMNQYGAVSLRGGKIREEPGIWSLPTHWHHQGGVGDEAHTRCHAGGG